MMARLACLGLGIAGAAGLAGGLAAFGPVPVLRGWLTAMLALLALPLGGLLLLMVDHLIPQGWSLRLNTMLEAAALTMPFLALGFIPLLLSPAALWPWAAPAAWPDDWPNRAWLAPHFFAARALTYFLVWWGFALLTAVRTRGQSRPRTAAGGLIALTLAATLAAFDWAMSLEPGFRSTIYGMMTLAGQTLAALALCTLSALLLGCGPRPRPGPMAGVLLSLVMLWGYLAFCQYLIVWSGDLPGEIAWYLRRAGDGWAGLIWVIGLGYGAVFLALVAGRVRHWAPALAVVAVTVVALHAVNTAWQIIPAWDGPHGPVVLAYMAALMAAGGIWGLAFLGLAWRRPVEEPSHG